MATLPTRLTAFAEEAAVDPLKAAPAAFRRVGEQFLVAGDFGGQAWLSPADFRRWLSGAVSKDEPLWKDLQAKGLVKDHIDFREAAVRTAARRPLVWSGPCVFRLELASGGRAMDLETVRRAVDWAFEAPAAGLTLELSGGTPLASWTAAEFAVRYARVRADRGKRPLRLVVDADPRRLDDARLKALLQAGAVLRFDLDGPAAVHDALAAAWGGARQAETLAWLKKAAAATSGEHEGFAPPPELRCRVGRASLGKAGEVADELLRSGAAFAVIEFVDPAGRTAAGGQAVAPEEFAAFYRAAFDRIAKAALKGNRLREGLASWALARVLSGEQWAFPEREPMDRVAFTPDGGIHVFDGGGDFESDELFLSGRLGEARYAQVLGSPAYRAALTASQLDGQPLCAQCAYRPVCTLDPAPAAAAQGTLWARMTDNQRCRVYMGVFDHLCQRSQEWEIREKLWPAWRERRAAA